jgi:acyl-CoA hydrolase
MKGKKVSESTVLMAQLMTPEDANPSGNVHGGIIMKLIDNAGGTAAARHARCNVVTASIDRLHFHYPVYIGNLITLKASLNMVGITSMEVGVRVEAENLLTGEVRHTASAYLTYVALDPKSRPKKVPPLIVENVDQARRCQEAKDRRELRQLERKQEASHQQNKD